MLAKNLSRLTIFLIDNCEQKMFGRDELVLHLLGPLLRRCENLREPRTEILLAALNPGEAGDRRFAIVLDYLNIGAELTEQRSNNSFRLIEHDAEQVFRLDLLILIPLSKFDSRLNCFLPAQCELI